METSEVEKTGRVLWLIGFLLILGLFAGLAFGGPNRPEDTESLGVLADPAEVYDPVKAGETPPSGYRQLLRRDSILPVYEPQFAAAGQVDWPLDSLVIGVAGTDAAKAYPVTHLNSREMVIDSLDGIPILVSW